MTNKHTPGSYQEAEAAIDRLGETAFRIKAERDRLREVNAELVKALREYDEVANEPNGHAGGWDAAMLRVSDQARAALARAGADTK